MAPRVKGGHDFLLFRGGKDSPDLQLLAPNKQQVEFVMQRPGQVASFGPDRQWNNLLVRGKDAFGETSNPPLLRIVRDTANEKMLLMGEGDQKGWVLADIDRVRKGNYGDPDVRHSFEYTGRKYILNAHKVLSGKDMSCTDAASGEVVASFKNTLWPKKQAGVLSIAQQIPEDQWPVLLAAVLALWEWDGRRTLLIWGQYPYNTDVVP